VGSFSGGVRGADDLQGGPIFLPSHLVSIYLSIGINVRFAAMMADVGDGLL